MFVFFFFAFAFFFLGGGEEALGLALGEVFPPKRNNRSREKKREKSFLEIPGAHLLVPFASLAAMARCKRALREL